MSGKTAAAPIDKLRQIGRLPAGVEFVPCADDLLWRAARARDVTASVAAALLKDQDGAICHEWETPFGLFQAKKGNATEGEETEPMRRGRLLEPVAVQVLRERHSDWTIRHNSGDGRVYYRDPTTRIGATPDIIADCPERGRGVVQIKSVESSVFHRKWKIDGEVEPPTWIAVQAIIEASLTGAQWASVAPIVVGHGVDVPEIEIPIHFGVMTRLRRAVEEFWDRIERDDPYPPDYARDGRLITGLYADDDGGDVDLSNNKRIAELLPLREALKAREADGAEAEKERKIIDAEIIDALGNAARGRLADGRVIDAKTVRRKAYAVAASSYRTVKVKEAKK